MFLGIICKYAKFHRNRRGDSQTIIWSDTEWPISVLLIFIIIIIINFFWNCISQYYRQFSFMPSKIKVFVLS